MDFPTMHILKCDKKPFYLMRTGIKTAEFRKNDRDFKVGDILVLMEWDGITYTGSNVSFVITHMQDGYGIPEGYVMISGRVIETWIEP